ncbi:MAG: LysR family transcriptional regulator [Pseudomonadota bacterium]
MQNLDSDLLRTFLAVAETGSVTDGAARVGRSQSAISIQIKRLEAVLNQPVFDRHGRGVVLSETGRRLLPIANDVTSRLDAALRDIAQYNVEGRLRLGIPDDHGQAKLSQIIASFTRQHPLVDLDVTCAISTGFPAALRKGHLDLAVYEVQTPQAHEELIFEDPTCWVSSEQREFATVDVLPVALFDHACWWRDAAIASLEHRGKPYRVVYSSQSVSGVLAAVEAGIAVGLLGRSGLHSGLRIDGGALGFSPTPPSKLVMATKNTEADAPISAMQSAIRRAFSPAGATQQRA